MAQETTYKRSLAGSIGAGMKSVMGDSGRRYYILEHKVSSKYHKAGESQRIIVDQVELGRDPSCQVRFDESFSTVSRRHAAIVRDGDNWKLVQLSKTNSTYLNGQKVNNEWYLQNGDEIQLSTNGPKLGFITPAGDKGLVKSIGLTARLNLFGKQALRPYRTGIVLLVVFLVLVCGVGGYFISNLSRENRAQAELIAENEEAYKKALAAQEERYQEALTAQKENFDKEVSTLKGKLGEVTSKQREIEVANGGINNDALTKCLPNVYFIYSTYFDLTLPSGESGSLECGKNAPGWSGTGFLLEDGTFVTARHVVEPWSYWVQGGEVEEDMLELNTIMNNGGKVTAHFVAVSSSGAKFNFSTNQFSMDKSDDKKGVENGYRLSLAVNETKDVATYKTTKTGGLKFNKNKSRTLKRGTKLMVLGFPLGLGANSPSSITPISSTCTVGVDGLDNGVILTSETNYEHGNSGGPVFVMDENGNYTVVGVVSASAGQHTGFIVPISNMK